MRQKVQVTKTLARVTGVAGTWPLWAGFCLRVPLLPPLVLSKSRLLTGWGWGLGADTDSSDCREMSAWTRVCFGGPYPAEGGVIGGDETQMESPALRSGLSGQPTALCSSVMTVNGTQA